MSPPTQRVSVVSEMPLALEARSAGGAVRPVTLTSDLRRLEAAPGTVYRFVDQPALAKFGEHAATVK